MVDLSIPDLAAIQGFVDVGDVRLFANTPIVSVRIEGDAWSSNFLLHVETERYIHILRVMDQADKDHGDYDNEGVKFYLRPRAYRLDGAREIEWISAYEEEGVRT